MLHNFGKEKRIRKEREEKMTRRPGIHKSVLVPNLFAWRYCVLIELLQKKIVATKIEYLDGLSDKQQKSVAQLSWR